MPSLVVERVVSSTLFTTVIADGCVVSPFLFWLWRILTPSGKVTDQLSPLIVTSPLLLDKTVFAASFKWTSTTFLSAADWATANPPNVPLIVRVVEVIVSAWIVGFGGVTFTTGVTILLGCSCVAAGASVPTCDFGKITFTW